MLPVSNILHVSNIAGGSAPAIGTASASRVTDAPGKVTGLGSASDTDLGDASAGGGGLALGDGGVFAGGERSERIQGPEKHGAIFPLFGYVFDNTKIAITIQIFPT